MNKDLTRKIAGVSMLAAVVIVLQVIAFYISFGQVNITLSLIGIVIAAVIYGPKYGALIGFINGIVVILAPSTLSLFMPINPIATILLCLIKMTVAGYVSGLLFKVFENKNKKLGIVLASIIVPILNTLIFAIGTLIFFVPLLEQLANGENIMSYLLISFIGINFIIEFLINSILSPVVYTLINVFKKMNK